MPACLSPVTYAPTEKGFSPSVGTNPYSLRYSTAVRSEYDSPMAPACGPVRLASGPPTMRLEIACVYSCPITDMS